MRTPSLACTLVVVLAARAGTPPEPSPASTPAPASVPPPSAPSDASAITGIDWQWVETVTPVETIRPDDPARYTLRIDAGQAAVRADCNRARGSVELGADRRVAFGALAMTRAMCPPGSQSDRYARDLGRAAIWFVREGDLYFDMPYDSGTLRFRRAPAP